MSWCRLSCMNRQCDFYIYESCYGGITINIAGRRAIPVKELPPDIDIEDYDDGAHFAAAWLEQQNKLDECYPEDEEGNELYQWKHLPEKWAGKTFNVSSYAEAASIVEEAVMDGLNAPEGLVDELLKAEEENPLDNEWDGEI